MGGSGGMFGSSRQSPSQGFGLSGGAKSGEKLAIRNMIGIASGQTPSIGQQQMALKNDMASRQAMALAASQRGSSNPMLAFRQAQMMNQQMGLENAQQAAIMGQQERMQANQMLLGQAAAQRGVALQSAVANQQNDAARSARDMQAAQSLVSGAGSSMAAAMASDENAKKNIEPKKYALDEIDAFLKVLKPSTYEYKDAKHGTGKKLGIMAQDLEKSEIGKTMVDTAPDGTKMVDTNKAIGAILAAVSELNKKVSKAEK